jgi:hypothetical protein
MKGEIEKVWKNKTEDGRKYEVFQVGGDRYSLWEENYLDKIQEGQMLEFDFRESGEFKNITKIYGNPGEGEPTPNYDRGKADRIIRMSSLRSASRMLVGSKIPGEKRADKTIEIAKKFEKYIFGDELEENIE